MGIMSELRKRFVDQESSKKKVVEIKPEKVTFTDELKYSLKCFVNNWEPIGDESVVKPTVDNALAVLESMGMSGEEGIRALDNGFEAKFLLDREERVMVIGAKTEDLDKDSAKDMRGIKGLKVSVDYQLGQHKELDEITFQDRPAR